MIIMYIDGAECNITNKEHKHKFQKGQFVVSWGIVAHHNDSTVELFGSQLAKINDAQCRGKHEKIAFIEAYLYAKSHGFKPNEMVFYSDDEFVSYVHLWDQEVGIGAGRKLAALNVLKNTVNKFYPNQPKLYNELLQCIKLARFHKVKGHANCVYNRRADYLCQIARNSYVHKPKPLKTFEEWFQTHLISFFEKRYQIGLCFFK